MNRNVVVGIVVVLALIVVGWWYWAMMAPAQDMDTQAIDESAGGAAGSIELSAMDLSGTWRSKQDARFIRVFTTDGTVTDRYEGDDSATVTGTWSVVEDPANEQAGLPVVKDAQIIKVQFPEEVMYFAITALTETDLTMLYLTGNGSLEFSRVN